MKKILLPLGTLTVAGAVALGLLGTAGANAADGNDTQDNPAFLKREDKVGSLVLVADDDDDDDNGDTRTRTRTGDGTGTQGTGSSRSRADGTSSRYSKVSRDADRSRGDLTRDWTRDGGDRTRDLTPNLTNDRSRNDTRG
ncbi:hypothetical protein [Nocardioides iriomotensis]|uniref:Uncharacterized protein n=1 Tax=Nocardioides iriomotensis TaxID=715784 RepID=A0A4Q5IWG2_9ACTN|nr:hypothetical protein [Nocardioides iriomotensis]RYU09488.1 hypothetical protein ETU37_20760 [Nocardioides iriomotensis]